MKIITDINDVRVDRVAATIGSFDGVHCGHRAMINEARNFAVQRGLPLMVITFARHPRLLFSGWESPFLLTSTDEKLELLRQIGVDYCVLLDFDEAMASLTAKEFMNNILLKKLNVSLLVIGYDHRFGRPLAGEGVGDYMEYGRQCGIEVCQASPYTTDGIKVSSSKIRGALTAGEVVEAAHMLGRNYFITGRVVHGAAIGRRLGFPTANISIYEPLKLLPKDGVYEVMLYIAGHEYNGVMNVGCKPTLNSSERTIEVFIIDFEGNIYDADVKVEFVRRLREERRFASLEDLRKQIEIDVNNVMLNKS